MTETKTSNKKFVAILLLIGLIACQVFQVISNYRMIEGLSGSGLSLADLIFITSFYTNINIILSMLSSVFLLSELAILVSDMN